MKKKHLIAELNKYIQADWKIEVWDKDVQEAYCFIEGSTVWYWNHHNNHGFNFGTPKLNVHSGANGVHSLKEAHEKTCKATNKRVIELLDEVNRFIKLANKVCGKTFDKGAL